MSRKILSYLVLKGSKTIVNPVYTLYFPFWLDIWVIIGPNTRFSANIAKIFEKDGKTFHFPKNFLTSAQNFRTALPPCSTECQALLPLARATPFMVGAAGAVSLRCPINISRPHKAPIVNNFCQRLCAGQNFILHWYNSHSFFLQNSTFRPKLLNFHISFK